MGVSYGSKGLVPSQDLFPRALLRGGSKQPEDWVLETDWMVHPENP